MHIAIAGNIGSGKTTLTRMLSKHYRWEAHFEDVDDNPKAYYFQQAQNGVYVRQALIAAILGLK